MSATNVDVKVRCPKRRNNRRKFMKVICPNKECIEGKRYVCSDGKTLCRHYKPHEQDNGCCGYCGEPNAFITCMPVNIQTEIYLEEKISC